VPLEGVLDQQTLRTIFTTFGTIKQVRVSSWSCGLGSPYAMPVLVTKF
jgi:hypothetical protein